MSSSPMFSWSWWLALADPARIGIFAATLLVIVYGSRRALILDRETDSHLSETIQHLKWYHVALFPFMSSLMLLLLFYFFDYLQFVFMLVVSGASVFSVYNFIWPILGHSFIKMYMYRVKLVSTVLSVVIVILWLVTGHWVFLDVLGLSLCVLMIQFLRLPNLKLSVVFLLGLLVYDVFWVFYSSSFFNANVMLEVATKKAENPVAVVAAKLNFPHIAKGRPPLSIPGKILVPSFLDDNAYAILGLGDIVLPGLLLSFAMRFDALSLHNAYFQLTLCGYAIGLLFANVMAHLFDAAQPALLYLVPSTLIPLVGKAVQKGDFIKMWSGPFPSSENNSYEQKQPLSV